MIPLIILAMENDDDRAFMISLYEGLYPMMKALAMEVVKDNGAAEDIVHDTVAAIIPKVEMLKRFERWRLRSYVNRTVHNRALNYQRKQQRERGHTSYEHEADDFDTSDTGVSMEERFEMLDDYMALGRALMMLPFRERELLLQKYYSNLSDREIGENLGIQKDSVREYMTRARRMLKEYFLREGAVSERG
jgi:RNA polymerase sigma-70 factor (ECF subfamily)